MYIISFPEINDYLIHKVLKVFLKLDMYCYNL